MKRLLLYLKMVKSTRYLVRRLETEFIESKTSNTNWGVVVDLGCGKAPYRGRIKCGKYIGVDIENRGDVPGLVVADINLGIPLASSFAELVICTQVLEHTRDPREVLREVHRIMREGATLLVGTPFMWPVNEPPNDYYRFTRYGIELMLKDAGFRKITIQESNGYWYSLCILFVAPLRNKIFIPIVVAVNVLGRILYTIERSRNFPTLLFVTATK